MTRPGASDVLIVGVTIPWMTSVEGHNFAVARVEACGMTRPRAVHMLILEVTVPCTDDGWGAGMSRVRTDVLMPDVGFIVISATA